MKELVLIGGQSDTDGDIHAYLAQKAQAEGQIGFIGFASDDPGEKAAKLRPVYAKYNVGLKEVKKVEDCFGLSVIYFYGGDQEKLAKELRSTKLDELLRPQWKKGNVLLAGSSAGAMIVFRDMLPSEGDRKAGLMDLIPGMGPMGGGFVVPHADTTPREYKQKLAKAYPGACIIAIDENTALRWRNGMCDVLGVGQVELMGRSKGIFKSGREFELSATM